MAKKRTIKRELQADLSDLELEVAQAVINVCLGARPDLEPEHILDMVLAACYAEGDDRWTQLGRELSQSTYTADGGSLQ